MKLIGVDIGGTKITAALIKGDKIVNQHTCPTPFDQEKMVVADAVVKTISAVFDPEIKGIGIGVPGLVDLRNGTVVDVVNIPSWDVVPLKKLMEERFGKPVYVNNDANCFAVGEKYFGKGKAFKNFVGITIGTGLGAGIVINGHLYSGSFCGAGEFGSMYYRDDKAEAYASGQFFKDRNLSGTEQYQLAKTGDKKALELFNELGGHIGRTIANVLYALAPEAIILGGSVTKSFLLFKQGIFSVLEKEFLYPGLYKSLQIEISELENSAIWGAASLVLDEVNLSFTAHQSLIKGTDKAL
ncbi:MAG: ROK family protein [Prolixibacteraceae bacterium]|jgi:glucokinase|nr:ROK family protein [Prolixibacteraceae bacterium]